ncbi:macrophage mannose receptor 1-like isoform X2 [Argopecten irradians]|uniref:macrophage mannose receptor 1-like isoform X2 n=1 Tax=Argopecten irradians TaxID=31199 RepID=UPI003717C55E
MVTTIRLVIVVILSTAQPTFGCDSGWMSHGDKCYLFSSFNESWSSAESFCRSFSAKLAEPMDQSSIDFLSGVVKGSAPLRTGYYIGGGDLFVEGQWIWVSTHTPISVTKWTPGEPNNFAGHEDCLEIWTTGLWRDSFCDDSRGFICEIEEEVSQGLIGGRHIVRNIIMATRILLVVVVILSTVQPTFGCGSGWVSHGEKCYLFSSFQETWSSAESFCRSFNSKLAEPMDQSSVNFLSGEVKGSAPLKTAYYIGGGDLFVEGEWIWVSTQTPISVTKWTPGEPNDDQNHEDCLEISAASGLWNDGFCDTPRGFICEMEEEVAQGLIG